MWRKILHKTQISISADAGSQYQNNTFLTPYFVACKRGIFLSLFKGYVHTKMKIQSLSTYRHDDGESCEVS